MSDPVQFLLRPIRESMKALGSHWAKTALTLHKISHVYALKQQNRRRHFWHARLSSAIRRHPPQRAVLSQVCCFGEQQNAQYYNMNL